MQPSNDSGPKAPRRGRPPSADLRRRIVDAAAALFARQGADKASTREVAAAAGTTERTLFKHFGSKQGLVDAVLAEAVLVHSVPESLTSLGRQIDAFDGDFEAWHRDLLHARLRDWRKAPERTRLLVIELLRHARYLESFAEQWLPSAWDPLVALFSELQREDRLRSDLEAAVLVRQFLALNLSYLLSRLVLAPGPGWNDDAEIAAIATVFSRGAAGR
ncbi:MAG: TetR/AcrR family transcriptional regulator [Candidatus Binatia bacterium]